MIDFAFKKDRLCSASEDVMVVSLGKPYSDETEWE